MASFENLPFDNENATRLWTGQHYERPHAIANTGD
jgi:hypothetical protein